MKIVLMTVAASFIGAAMVLSSMPLSTSPTLAFAYSSSSSSSGSYTVIARNDLGMHCACPTFEGFLLLPPANTMRVQVLKKGGDSVSVVSSGITVSYSWRKKPTRPCRQILTMQAGLNMPRNCFQASYRWWAARCRVSPDLASPATRSMTASRCRILPNGSPPILSPRATRQKTP